MAPISWESFDLSVSSICERARVHGCFIPPNTSQHIGSRAAYFFRFSDFDDMIKILDKIDDPFEDYFSKPRFWERWEEVLLL